VATFLEKNDGVAATVSRLVSPGDDPEQKLRKIYAFVTALPNQSHDLNFARQKGYPLEYQSAECVMESGIVGISAQSAAGCVNPENSFSDNEKLTRGVTDVLHGGGTHDELNRLFVAMARAAGIPGSLLWVTDRSQQAFLKEFLSTDQLDGELAVVQLAGKDVFLDPGTKFCPYGMIDWRYSSAMGLRQNATGSEFGESPSLDYKQSLITRKADLVLDSSGFLSGTVSLVFKGMPAMVRRKIAEAADTDLRKKILVDELTGLLRGTSEAELLNSPDWSGADAPLVAQFRVRVPVHTSSKQELSLVQQVFKAGENSLFPAETRSNAIDFQYPWQEADEVHVSLPAGVAVEKLAQDDSLALPYARYRVQFRQEAMDKLYARRDFIMGTGLLRPEKYKELKEFFEKIAADDAQITLMKFSVK
jgi:hypothetical protein